MQLLADHVVAIAEAHPEEHAPTVWIGAVLGWRWEEVAGLRVGALDLLRGTATVVETNIRDAKDRLLVGKPKSLASKRTVAMPEALVEVLAAHMAAMGLTAADSDRLLFEAPGGGPLRYANWRARVWLPAVKAAQCEGAGCHDLRRANATQLVAGGTDPKTAQTRLGHSDIRLTLGLYPDAVDTADRKAAESLGDVFLGSRATRATGT
jgi:integrase